MNNKELTLFAAKVLDEKKASDISILDISERSGFADYFIIATATNLRLLGALCDELDDRLTREGVSSHHIEGRGDSGWILMDYGDLIVNLFTVEQRAHYNIDKVWGDCPRLAFEASEA